MSSTNTEGTHPDDWLAAILTSALSSQKGAPVRAYVEGEAVYVDFGEKVVRYRLPPDLGDRLAVMTEHDLTSVEVELLPWSE